MFAVDVLMQRVEVALAVLQQKGGRPRLPRFMAAGDEVFVRLGVALRESHRGVPPVGDRRQLRVESRAQRGDLLGQRILEVLVFAASKPVSCHDDVAAEKMVVRIKRRHRAAIARRQQSWQ